MLAFICYNSYPKITMTTIEKPVKHNEVEMVSNNSINNDHEFLYFSEKSLNSFRNEEKCTKIKQKDNYNQKKKYNYLFSINNTINNNNVSKSIHLYKNPLIKYDENFYEKNSYYLKEYLDTVKKIVKNSSNSTSSLSSTSYKSSESSILQNTLPNDGVQLTLSELREMASRQQTQIETQQRLLAAKEQRLRYLREQDAKQQRVPIDSEKLRVLRERVENQELKLRKLRNLRGQVDQNKQNNITLTSDLESIRSLFNEKEKELAMAVAKVEELTKQLEELRRGRISKDQNPSVAAQEFDKLRRELMYRNKLNEQQNVRLNQQREALTARQEEMISIDKRISELQERLQRKRLLNQQLASQINATALQKQHDLSFRSNGQSVAVTARSNNIAAVEPYNHIINACIVEQKNQNLSENKQNVYFQQNQQTQKPSVTHQQYSLKNQNNQQHTNTSQQIRQQHQYHHLTQNTMKPDQNEEILPEFIANKLDSKYQTLPYNTKFSFNLVPVNGYEKGDVVDAPSSEKFVPLQSQHFSMTTVHSIPLTTVSKNLATSPSQNQNLSQNKLLNDLIHHKVQNVPDFNNSESEINTNIISNNNGLLLSSHNTNYNNLHKKPINSVAPTSVQNSSNIFQSSSIKIQPVQPQLIQQQQQNPIQKINNSNQSVSLNSENNDEIKPQLPPKPVIKPPPRQTQPFNQLENNLQADNVPKENGQVIKAKPLMLRKWTMLEQPKLKSLPKLSNGVSISINRRIDIPVSFYSNDEHNENMENSEVFKNLVNKELKESPISNKIHNGTVNEVDKINVHTSSSITSDSSSDSNENFINASYSKKTRKGNLKQNGKCNLTRRVSFDPLALLLDASLEGELELVKKTAGQVTNPSAANDEGITALHNAICAGHLEIVKFLVEFGCDVNAQDSDGWTPLHCAASCNNVAMVKFLVENGACIFATTLSDHETAADKCEEDEEGFDGCSEYLYSVQEKLGILNNGIVYAVFDYTAQNPDELSFTMGNQMTILRKGDENEREWWWARLNDSEGYIPRNLLGLHPRVTRIQQVSGDVT